MNLSEKAKKSKIGTVLFNNVKLLGGSFGETSDVKKAVINGCINSVISNFSHYGIDDINNASELWSLGEIGNKATEMYSGLFNVMILNRILKEYESHRKVIVNNYIKSQESEYEAAEKKWKKYGKQQIAKISDEDIINIIKKYDNFMDIPWYSCTLAFSRKLIELSEEEIKDYKVRAKAISESQVKSENNNDLALGLIGKSEKELGKNILDREKVVAVKLSVFEKLGNGK